MQIRPDRLIADLRQLAKIGKYEAGVHRPAFSDADMAAREWLRDKMTEAGLSAGIDGCGNVYGMMPSVEKAALVGSHSDTVPHGGWLDGSLGVIYGLEIARCFLERGHNGIGVDVISFQDEEGTYLALFGSRSFCSEDVQHDAAKAMNKDGQSLKRAVAEAGLDGRALARLDLNRHLAYFEAHIEQGPRLERSGLKIGVVTAIVGIKTFQIVFLGQADHAGTTPMSMRHDAGSAALKFGASISEWVRERGGPETVWNVGSAAFKPGASNVVPSEAGLVFQMRDSSASVLNDLERIVFAKARECAQFYNVDVKIERTLDTQPAEMHPELAKLIEQAASETRAVPLLMPSGAGHDAMVMAKHLPSAMLFVPSIGGRSHHVSEDTHEGDIIVGAQVLLRAVEQFARNSNRN